MVYLSPQCQVTVYKSRESRQKLEASGSKPSTVESKVSECIHAAYSSASSLHFYTQSETRTQGTVLPAVGWVSHINKHNKVCLQQTCPRALDVPHWYSYQGILDYVNLIVKTNHHTRVGRIVEWLVTIATNMLSKLLAYRGKQNTEPIVCCGWRGFLKEWKVDFTFENQITPLDILTT